jgi:uncharacterized protein (DUF885 family)
MRPAILAPVFAALMAAMFVPVRAHATPHDSLETLAQDITFSSAKLFPMQATFLGIAGHDGELENPTEAFRAAYITRLKQWQQRLQAITTEFTSATTLVDRDDAKLLAARLDSLLTSYLVYQEDRKDYSRPANSVVSAVFTQFENLTVAAQDGATAKDVAAGWEDITTRLAKTPVYIVTGQRLVATPGHLYGVVGSKQLAGVPEFLNKTLTEAARQQLGANTDAYPRFLKARDAALAAIARTKAYIDAHVASWPENYAMGRKAYDHMLRDDELVPFDTDDIERMGQDELAHGWAEEAWLSALSKHSGKPFGPESGGGMAPSGAALIGYYQDRVAELRKFVLDNDVVSIPPWLGTIKVMETPPFLQPVSPGASMNSPRLFAKSTTGFYYITPPTSLAQAAARLDMNQDFDHDRILSTAAHEVMPGHFLQLSVARRNPDFIRKIQDSGEFAEGWAYYGEEMFVRLGLYGSNLDGRLFTARWERVRGARATVDPKLATGEWTYEQAVDFFVAQAGFTKGDAEEAVAGIATGPGYVIDYTTGRLQLELILAKYMQKMGARGSLHDFHDRLLSYGTTPLAIVGPELLRDLDKSASEVRAAANY